MGVGSDMGLKRLYNLLLILLLFTILSANVLVVIALTKHANCVVENCVPCLYIVKLRDVLQAGAMAEIVVVLALFAVLYIVVSDIKNRHTPSLVNLKTRMNN